MTFLPSSRKDGNISSAPSIPMTIAVWRYRGQGRNHNHMLEYFGPPPPSGGTQVMLRLGSLMSQVLQ